MRTVLKRKVCFILMVKRPRRAADIDNSCALQVRPLYEGLPEQLLQDILLALNDPCSLELSKLQNDIAAAIQLMPPQEGCKHPEEADNEGSGSRDTDSEVAEVDDFFSVSLTGSS